jgi:cytochrome P450
VTANGLVASEGELWRRQRRLLQPAFQRQHLAGMAGMITDATSAMLESWQVRADDGRPIDLSAEMNQLALNIVGRVLFGTDLRASTRVMGPALGVLMEYLHYRLNHPFSLPAWLPTGRNRRFRRALRAIDRVVADIIEERRHTTRQATDMLATLLAARDDATCAGLTERQLRDEVISFLLAGHETIGTALTWTSYLCAIHPGAGQRLVKEIASVLEGRIPTAEDLPRLPYSRMVVEETLRLYPPIWLLVRDSLHAGEIGSYPIPARSMVFVVPFCTHRHPQFWKDPEQFDPERFAPESSLARPRQAYFPFGVGPHQCIGNEFALMEAQLVTVMVAQRFRLEPRRTADARPDPVFTLRPPGGMWMKIRTARVMPTRRRQ